MLTALRFTVVFARHIIENIKLRQTQTNGGVVLGVVGGGYYIGTVLFLVKMVGNMFKEMYLGCARIVIRRNTVTVK